MTDSKAEAVAFIKQGQFEQATQLLDRRLTEVSNDAEARFLRAHIFIRSGRWGAAREDLEEVLRLQPRNYDAMVLVGLALKNERRYLESVRVLMGAITLNPSNASAYNTLGMCYLEMREAEKAIEALQRAVERDPRSGAIYYNLGLALRLGEKRPEALGAFRSAVELAPENPATFLSLAQQLQTMGLKDEAVQVLQIGQTKHPESLPIMLVLAQAYGDTNRPDKAEELFQKCQTIDPSSIQAYAIWLQKEGRFTESIQAIRDSIESQPIQGLAYMSLAEAKVFTLNDESPWAARIPALLEDPRLPSVAKMHLWYALARSKENDRDYRAAMKAFDAANDLAFATYNEGRQFDFGFLSNVTDRTINLYTAKELERVSPFGSDSEKPIFIVGMIRSGTTLLDQVISRHSLVKSAGECEFWMEKSDYLNARWNAGILEADLKELAHAYLREMLNRAGDASFITDKMPLNFLHLGQIRATFPNAKILHIRRNALDTCLSIYATPFGGGPNFAYKKKNIVFYYQEYLRLMEHWRQVLPAESFFELDYEELVRNQKRVVSDVLGFCGLPWEDSCLQPEGNLGRISTPSRWQARQPIYLTSVEKWKAYEPWLGEFESLKSVSHPEA